MTFFAMDYDDTYTRDRELWRGFIDMAAKQGSTVFCVTARGEKLRAEVVADVPACVEVVCTAGEGKMLYCESHGVPIDVWIDDSPFMVVAGHNALGGYL